MTTDVLNRLSIKDIPEILARNPVRLSMLEHVAALDLPDCWIAAGFVRNPVWDHMHGFKQNTLLNDVDVLFFDSTDLSQRAEEEINAELTRRFPGPNWEARNQARMHIRNKDQQYFNTAHAMTHWLETVTPVAARMNRSGEMEILAPLGVDDLLNGIVRPTPYALSRPEKLVMYRKRMIQKNWTANWKQLKVLFN